jgi:hypothetical protein
MNKEDIDIYSLKTSWLNKKECDDCRMTFKYTVEFNIDGCYTNLCNDCFNKTKKGDI